MTIKTHKTLTLTLGAKTVQCALTRAALVDNPDTEELTTFCGTQTSAIPNYTLEIGGFQDWGYTAAGAPGPPVVEAYDAVCDILHTAYTAQDAQGNQLAAEIDFVLTIGTATRTGKAVPISDVPFGGDAGAALAFDTTLDVVGAVTDGP
jgi:hypothetical protein